MAQRTEVTTVRQLPMPDALALADQAAVFEELQFVLKCCERLVTELAGPRPDEVVLESVRISALNSYGRCFRPGARGMGLTEADLTATGLAGDVPQWHKLLGELREFYLNSPANPRETFSVGAAQALTANELGALPLIDVVTLDQGQPAPGTSTSTAST